MTSGFLAEALTLARRLCDAAITHEDRCTWIGDEFRRANGGWQQVARTLGPTFGSGTAGVGWALAQTAQATGDRRVAVTAAAAIRHSLARSEQLMARRSLDRHEGSTGVAWAAIDTGRVLGCAELVHRGLELAARSAGATRSSEAVAVDSDTPRVLDGLLALHALTAEPALLDAASDLARRLMVALGSGSAAPRIDPFRTAAALAQWATRSGQPDGLTMASDLLALTRWPSTAPGDQPACDHEWAARLPLAGSWCRGAAGVGLAALAVYAGSGAADLLARVSAAIQAVRFASFDAGDASIGHGASGPIEMMLSAAAVLSEDAHLDAARRAGERLVAGARARGGYGTALGPGGRTPGLLLGLAGTVSMLVRLHDPVSSRAPFGHDALGPQAPGARDSQWR